MSAKLLSFVRLVIGVVAVVTGIWASTGAWAQRDEVRAWWSRREYQQQLARVHAAAEAALARRDFEASVRAEMARIEAEQPTMDELMKGIR